MSPTFKPIVIVSAPCHPWLLDELAKDCEVTYLPEVDYSGLEQIITGATGLVVTTRIKVDAALLAKATKLKWIGRLGSGLELIDDSVCRQRNITLLSSPEGNRNAVAEHAVGMLLSLLNKIKVSNLQVAEGLWLRNENRGTELSGKTVGIIGFGNTGAQFAKLLSAFDVTVLAYDRNKHGFAGNNIREAQPEQIQRYADVISFHVPLNEYSRHMCNKDFLNRCMQKPVIINTSRGEVVKTEDLIWALEKEVVSGACLDVLENEKLETYTETEKRQLDWLLRRPDVIITPHVAGYSHEAYLKMAQVLYKKITNEGLL